MGRVVLIAVLAAPLACTSPIEIPHCAEPPLPGTGTATVSWHRDIRPIIFGRCSTCHVEGGHAPFALTGYPEAAAYSAQIREAVITKKMPPWLPANCCNDFQNNFGLTDAQIELIVRWVDQGAVEGPRDRPAPPLPPVGGLSRVDLELTMPVAYRPQPPPGKVDDYRCFLLDWTPTEPMVVSGLNPVPGARSIVHHLIVGVVDQDEAEGFEERDGEDDRPGVPCEGGFGEFSVDGILGGSLIGGDFPPGIGKRIEPGSKILLNVHYAVTNSAVLEDRTTIQFKLEPEDTPLLDLQPIVLANPAWLVSDAYKIKAGEKKTYRHRIDPALYTADKTALLRGLTPHMHYLASGMAVTLIREDGSQKCILDIPRWNFGWEQPFFFKEPVALEPGDELQIQCDVDNTQDHQPFVDGVRPPPRDIAWGSENQDMCVGFLGFTVED